MENTKKCSKCGRELPLSEFYKDKSKKDGLTYWCKDCQKQHNKQYRASHKEDKAEYMKRWRADNAEEIAEYNKQWRSTIEGYAYNVRHNNLQADIKYGRCGKDKDPLPSLEEYIELLQQRDFYDGKHYHWSEMGVDRIDNSKPHTLDNVVPCSTANNIRRHKMPFKEFCELMRKEKDELNLILN